MENGFNAGERRCGPLLTTRQSMRISHESFVRHTPFQKLGLIEKWGILPSILSQVGLGPRRSAQRRPLLNWIT